MTNDSTAGETPTLRRDSMDSRLWLTAIGSLMITAGCAGTQERGTSMWPSLPSPWSTVKRSPPQAPNNPARSSASLASSKAAASAKSKAATKGKKKDGPEEESDAMSILRGRNFERSGEWVKAREVYETVRTREPDNAEAAHRLGVVADHQRRHAEAEQ